MSKLQKGARHSPTPGEIFLLEEPRLRNSTYPHYCLVIRVIGSRALVNFMSSKFDLFKDRIDVAIYTSDAEFKATGLQTDTYLVCEDYALIWIPAPNLYVLGGPAGIATGRFLERIEDWWGEKL